MSAEREEMSACGDCGMMVYRGEYHPYAACLMFKSCHNGETVRANLKAVIKHGRAARLEGEGVERVKVYCRIDDPDQKTARVDVVEGEIPWSMNRVIVALVRRREGENG